MYNEQMIQELRKRWNALQQALAREGGDAILITTNVNLFYVSGRIFSGAAYVRPEGDPLFFVRRPVGLKGGNVIYIRKPEEIVGHLQQRGIPMPAKLFFETDSISYNEYRRYEKIFDPRVVCNGTQLLRGVRSIKTIYEIGRIMRSGVLHARLYERIPSLYRPGMTDTELSIEIERESRRLGSLGIFRIFGQSMEIFMGSLLAGDNADAPSPYDFALGGAGLDASLPVGGNGTPLTDGTSVMVDMGGNFTGYMTDMTRMYIEGEPSVKAVEVLELSASICRALADMMHPGVPAADLYNKALQMATDAGMADFFMGHRSHAGFVGHGVGIEINELPVIAPRSRDILAAGNVIALEPKFVVPGLGAIGIENTYVVAADGAPEVLTKAPENFIRLD